MRDIPAESPLAIDPEVFFRDFLATDPKYRPVLVVLDRVRLSMAELLGREHLPLSEFIDMTSIEYDQKGVIVSKDERMLKELAAAMKQADVDRESLKIAASSTLTPEQIAEGPTSIKLPVALLRDDRSFHRFAQSLSPAYHDCRDFCALIRVIHASRLHQKPLFLLFDPAGDVMAYFSPSWSMREMFDGLLLRDDPTALQIYNAKTPINGFCALVRDTPEGHVKGIYLGRRGTPGKAGTL